MSKKGYTIIELLSVIVIVALLSGIAVISYTYFINKANNSVYENYIDSLHEASIMYFSNHIDNLPTDNSSVYFCTNNCPKQDYISFSELNIESIKNPKDNNDKCLNSYIVATRNDHNGVISIEYHIYLKCNNYENDKTFIN